MKNSILKSLKKDLPAGLVVFLVALPLCLGIAQATGHKDLSFTFPVFTGIIAGIIGGIIVGSISGSQLGVSGPAAGLVAILSAALLTFNNDMGLSKEETLGYFFTAVILSGFIQIGLGFLKAGIIAYYVPNSVIKGMLAGIGIIIILKEIPHAFGYDSDPMGDDAFFQPNEKNTFSQIWEMTDYISYGAILISVISILIFILWSTKLLKKMSFTKIIQAPLVVVGLGIGLNEILFHINPTWALGSSHLVDVPEITSWASFKKEIPNPSFEALGVWNVWKTAIYIAVVASIETLLCVEATDKLDPYKRTTPTNRELKAQGVGNAISGLLGGLPITQVIVRSSANIQSGGKSKVSAIFHGILLLGCALAIPKVLNLIPMASLAAILLVVGYKLAKPSLFKEMFKKGMTQFIPFVVTIVAMLLTDLLIGVLIGLGVSILFTLFEHYKNPYFFNWEQSADGHTVRLEFAEEVSFINKASIQRTLNNVPDGSHLIIDLGKNLHMDQDIQDVLDEFHYQAEYRKIKYEIVNEKSSNTQNKEIKEFQSKLEEKKQIDDKSNGSDPVKEEIHL